MTKAGRAGDSGEGVRSDRNGFFYGQPIIDSWIIGFNWGWSRGGWRRERIARATCTDEELLSRNGVIGEQIEELRADDTGNATKKTKK